MKKSRINKLKPEKWGNGHNIWWESLSLDEKRKYKQHFEKLRQENPKKICPYPHMYNLTNLRLSQLSNRHIYRIWCFKDHPLNQK